MRISPTPSIIMPTVATQIMTHVLIKKILNNKKIKNKIIIIIIIIIK
jgi:hypothetical protein